MTFQFPARGSLSPVKLRIGESITRGLSQFSFDENGTVPFRAATVILSPILTWYEGTCPPRPAELEDGRKMPSEGGLLIKGNKGTIMGGVYGARWKVD